MIPSVLAEQIQKGLTDYIDTTFPITNLVFKDALKKMLSEPKKVFHEPYVAVRLPFRIATGDEALFQAIHHVYTPYVHQQNAFRRLTGEDGRSTLIATGTGSGKTECFLYPILEYCYRHRGENGIKALIIYPMNALAADQAKRMAELVNGSPELSAAKIRVGMYVGGHEQNAAKMMMPDRVITDHDILLASPPDILMTNYKMLDYLLVRPKDAELWKWNGPETLKYIAVDELHTFDGAQGTDLACLLRRLKLRLNIMAGHLCCIGTSATMGGADMQAQIRHYAEDIFGEAFEDDAVITEDRLSPEEYFSGTDTEDFKIPDREMVARLNRLVHEDDMKAYLKTAAEAWLDGFAHDDILSDETRVQLGHALKRHGVFKALIHNAKGDYKQSRIIAEELSERFPEFTALGEDCQKALDALYALISHARQRDAVGKLRPFLTVQVQVWLRELRRLMAKVDDHDIDIALASDLNDEQSKQYLPVVNCRDCGETGWASIVNEMGKVAIGDLSTFYNLYFECDSRIRFIFPHLKGEQADVCMAERQVISPIDMALSLEDEEKEGQLSCSGHSTFPVWVFQPEHFGSGRGSQFVCPFCGSPGGMAIMGLRSATALGATISELYASHFNDDKKLLAFTDNVQDASHHAGFYNARTWRFGLRTAMQQYAQTLTVDKSLKGFTEDCVRYWKATLGNEKFLSYFVAPSLTWMRGYDDLISENAYHEDKDGLAFMESVTRRAEYEMMLEFGMSARIGRSLEKSGCLVLDFDFEGVVDRIRECVVNECGLLSGAGREDFERMTMGVLLMMKQNGAFSHPIYVPYVANGGSRFVYKNNNWLPGMREGRNVPKFITIGGKSNKNWFFDDVSERSWYGKWIDKYLPWMHSDDDCDRILAVMLRELTELGVVDKMVGPDNISAWGISYAQTRISREALQMVCDRCGSRLTVSRKNGRYAVGLCCLRTACSGHYEEAEKQGVDFYGKLYSHGEMVRVVAREHTGLLERGPREELERTFKKPHPQPWDANLLSCTPTLEMGIDIGDLSTVVMCSIPPAQAQYAQRAGRGGRTDGNSLVVAVANAKPHDLYFYAEPEEMISGGIEPPRIFLRATAVLSRQFMAYCMDSWVKTGKAEIPSKLNPILANLDTRDRTRFPFNYLNYVQNNLSRLVRTFIQTFSASAGGKDGLDADAKNEITHFAMGDGQGDSPLYMKMFEEFRSIRDHKKSIQANIGALNEMVKALRNKPKDVSYEEEIKELKGEIFALGRVVHDINERNTFEFMSDQGLLPNYAFPEAGIILKAILYREATAAQNDKSKTEKYTYEYSRSASAAISEFAPLNSFYAGGKKLNIDQIDLNTKQIEQWRLCPSCSHAAQESYLESHVACPKCGSAGWGDAGQVRPMLKVQMVYANMKYKDSVNAEDSDDRSVKFYNKAMMIEVADENDIDPAYSMDNSEFPFGYEFVRKATMREINFGEKDLTGDKFSVAGEEAVRKGFTVCKHCGKVQMPNKRPQHTRFCSVLKDKNPCQEPFETCLFLYRQFETEAIRILVPATSLDTSKVRVESFVAAFMLGMKKKFGNIDHLGACVSEVPVPDAGYKKQYLVIYDMVPGGTGYLRQLMNDTHGMIDVLELAVAAMETCPCRLDAQKDGCYKCLYAYRQSPHIGEISRQAALDMFRNILSGTDNLKKIKNLSLIDTNPLFGSELERQFLEAFNRFGSEKMPIEINKKLVNEKEGYVLKIGANTWDIEPQVELGKAEDVIVICRPDFVFWPVRKTGNQKPVAVFTDGFSYHKDSVSDDFLKRMAILRSGRFRVWSLSYLDVQDVFKSQGDYWTDTLCYEKTASGSKLYMRYVKSKNAQDLMVSGKTPFELLIEYLSRPDAEDCFAAHARAFAFSLPDWGLMKNRKAYDAQAGVWLRAYESMDAQMDPVPFDKAIYGCWEPRQMLGNLAIYAMQSMEDKEKKWDAPIWVLAVLNDGASRTDHYQSDWNGYLNFFNVMQFMPDALFMTQQGMDARIYTALLPEVSELSPNSAPGMAEDDMAAWEEYFEYFDDAEKEMATMLIKAHIPAPDCLGYELENEKGAVIGDAFLAWETRRMALLKPEQEKYRAMFEQKGWTVFSKPEDLTLEQFGVNTDG